MAYIKGDSTAPEGVIVVPPTRFISEQFGALKFKTMLVATLLSLSAVAAALPASNYDGPLPFLSQLNVLH